MKKALNLGVIGIDHGHIFDMLDEMIKEGCSCNYFLDRWGSFNSSRI